MKRHLKMINILVASAMSISIFNGYMNNSNVGNAATVQATASVQNTAVNVLKAGQNEKGEKTNYYFYDATADGHKSVRSDILTSDYYIFAGNKSEKEAKKLVSELNMMDEVQEWGSRVYVLNPINGKEYTDADREALIDLVGVGVRNVKVIGIDEGATFVNNNISQSCYFIAGIMTYGGKIDKNVKKNDTVPAYLSSPDNRAEKFYKNINETTEKEKKDKYTIYRNKDNKLQAVAVSNKKETLAQAFENAWESIFSQNYRQHNSIAEFYNLSARAVTEDYEILQTPVFDEIGITYNQMIDAKVTGMDGKYTWFEYVPNTIEKSEDKSAALIVALHGNQNDPRLEGDSTGWPELAAKENFIVVAPEWQEREVNYFKCDGLGGDGVMKLIEDLKVKYPQIDPSRIYLTGLSIGGAETFLLAAQHNDVFAAAAPISGVNVFADQVTEIADNYKGHEMPLLYMCGDHDFFQMIPVDGSSKFGTQYLYGDQVWDKDKNTHIFSSLQAYQKMNGLDVSQMDMSKNEFYGIELDNQRWTKLGSKDMLTGTLSNENGVIMELAALKDVAHWNYKPEAEYIWNFFEKYARNTETGELIFKK